MKVYDNIVVGGGLYGLEKFLSLNPNENNLLIDDNDKLGGFINQVLEGINYEDEKLNYINDLLEKIKKQNFEVMLNTFVVEIKLNLQILCSNEKSQFKLRYKNIHLCNGVIEVNPWQQNIQTKRINGVYNFECVLRHILVGNKLKGTKVLIIGENKYTKALSEKLNKNYEVQKIEIDHYSKVSVIGKGNLEYITYEEKVYECDILIIPGTIYSDNKLLNLYNKNMELSNFSIYEYNEIKNKEL